MLVVTVDPARRLAHALGLRQGGGVERVRASAFAGAGAAPRGELWAEMLDTKQSWDTLVNAPRPRPRHGETDPGQSPLPGHLVSFRPEP